MTTSIYKIRFKNGATYNVFCENKAQGDKFYKLIQSLKNKNLIEWYTLEMNSIHTFKKFNQIME